MTAEPKYLTIQAAADTLATNRRRIWQMIRDGELHATTNPLDRREKLLLRTEVEKLSEFAQRTDERAIVREHRRNAEPSAPQEEAADSASTDEEPPWPRTVGAVDLGIPSDRVKDWLRANWHPE
jgi:hypothetical protein